MKESVWSPLKVFEYRAFWICAFLSNLGTWIQDVASSWVMTHLSSSPLTISLLSFSNSLPVLFLSIPAGILSDQGHRRKILLLAQALMFTAAVLLAFAVWSGKATELLVLSLVLLMGIGFALTGPAFQSVLVDLVPSSLQAQAVLVYYMGINITRVLGPTIGGGILSAFGPAAAFWVNSVSYMGLILFFWKWPVKEPIEHQKVKIETQEWTIMFSLHNFRLWFEIFIVTFMASSLWALYPTRGRVELGLSSLQYGTLLAFLGIGASVSAFMSDKIMMPEKTQRSLGGAYLVYALGAALIGIAPNYPVICAGMFFAGIGWIVLATLMNMSTRQITSKTHLKATMLGAFFTVFYAGMATGAVTWGTLAKYSSTTFALIIASISLAIVGTWKFRN
ncbi:enterobactin exporter EntS [compost metagenome]